MLRGLTHFWRINLAVLAGAAVNTAVLTGALLVGDSVRGSLRDLTLDRLGSIDEVLVAQHFFRQELAEALASRSASSLYDEAVAPAILLPGTVVQADTRARASKVSVHGIDHRFEELFPSPTSSDFTASAATRTPDSTDFSPPIRLDFHQQPGQIFPSIIINEALQRELDARIGDPILVYFRLGKEVPQETLLGGKDPEEQVGTVRCTLTAVIPDRGLGRFGLSPHQTFPLNAYLSLEQLQQAVNQDGRANALLVARGGDHRTVSSSAADAAASSPVASSSPSFSTTDAGAASESLLRQVLTLDDLGLETRWTTGPTARHADGEDDNRAPANLVVESRELVLRPSLVTAIEDEAAALGAPTLRIQTYLANTMEANGGLLPYSTVTAVEEHGLEPAAAAAAAAQSRTTKTAGGGPFPPLRLVDGSPAPVLAADEILLNEWAAKDLEIGAGDSLRMSYYVVGAHEELRTDATEFRVAGVLSIAGLAADPALTPDYPGIQDADDISQWDPPFPVDLDLVRPVDEAYWDDYRATPKAFVSPQTAQRLWSTRYGSTTSVRLGVPAGMEPQEFRAAFGSGLLETINLPLFGFRFLHVKEDGLSAAAGATDFSGLFIGFSFFLIISAALLVGLLFSLGVEQRASEVGLRLSVGYPVAKVRRQMLAEGGLLAAGGAVVGLLGGVAYGWLLMVGLRTLWLPAVGSPLLFLHVEPVSLIIGWLSSVAVVLVSIWWTVRRLGRVPTPSLLAGSFFSALAGGAGRRRLRRLLAFSSGGLALALFLFAAITGTATSPAIAMGIGSLLLIAGLSCFAIWCRGAHGMLPPAGWAARIGMAARNSAWSPGRSILSVALVASACFVIVAVAANHRNPASESQTTESGGGGYDLIATSDVPLLEDLNKRESLFDLGFADSEANVLADVQITALRRLPGDDASCLNLYRPQRPIILGVPHSQVERGGFAFASLIEETEDPWQLLEVEMEPGVVPAFGDANSVQWILHLGLGKDLQMEDEFGRSLRLRLVGLLAESIFQSQLLISEGNFLRHFPNQGGYSTFLIDATEGKVDRVAQLLEANLTQFGFDTTSTEEKVAGFLAVQNTYLSTFQMLGGLGLLLGTFGLAFVMMRNVIERRGELATLRAFGFRRSSLTTMVLAENLFLLLTGAVIGSLSALAAVAPRFLAGALQLPWSSLLATLILMLLAGLLSSIAAVGVALRAPLLPVLKAER